MKAKMIALTNSANETHQSEIRGYDQVMGVWTRDSAPLTDGLVHRFLVHIRDEANGGLTLNTMTK
jgi:hypothetical protein